jgi:hypothetical protein
MWFKSECNRISDQLWEYTSQRLSASETTRIESHLQQCARCQAEADAYRQTIGMLGAARQMPVPASQTTWRDLRPSLAPERRLALRTADLLPRLTLGGAGAALAATLLVVFLNNGHQTPVINRTTPGTSGQRPVAVSGTATTPTTDETAQNNTEASDTETTDPNVAASHSVSGSFLAVAPSMLSMPSPAEKTTAPAPNGLRIASPHRRSYVHSPRLLAGNGHSRPAANSEEADAQLDGGNVAPRAQQNYVLNPVSASSDDETARHYVLSSIPASQNGASTVASNDGADEGRAW